MHAGAHRTPSCAVKVSKVTESLIFFGEYQYLGTFNQTNIASNTSNTLPGHCKDTTSSPSFSTPSFLSLSTCESLEAQNM